MPVSDGHTAAVFVSFDKKPSKEEILKAWAEFRGPAQELDLPSAPKQFLHYFEENDRPQPKLDRNTEHGMAVCIGRLREDTLFDYKFACMSHNTLRGALAAQCCWLSCWRPRAILTDLRTFELQRAAKEFLL